MLLNLIEKDHNVMFDLYEELSNVGIRCVIIFGNKILCNVSQAKGEIVISNYPIGNAHKLNAKTLARFVDLNSNRLSFNALLFTDIIRRRYANIL